jgi:Metallopeptidase family M24
MRLATVRGIAEAQRVTRNVIHDVAGTIAAGESERAVARRIEGRLLRAGVRAWLHTPYAWFGDRTRFAGFHDWEPDALPSERRLAPGEPFILDAAPFVDGHPADYALSAVLDPDGEQGVEHERRSQVLLSLRAQILGWARAASTGKELFDTVGDAIGRAGYDVVHSLYPGAVLGHSFDVLPAWLQRLPRVGWGFQLPLVAGYALALLRHSLAGAPYPLINHAAGDRPSGIFAVEPHIASGGAGAKFESVLIIDGDETRWLDSGLFGEMEG